jgi:hypothetical protein
VCWKNREGHDELSILQIGLVGGMGNNIYIYNTKCWCRMHSYCFFFAGNQYIFDQKLVAERCTSDTFVLIDSTRL